MFSYAFAEDLNNILMEMMRPFVTKLDLKGEDNSFPPYNIKRFSDEKCVIELAVAGIPEEELSITVEKNVLVVSNNKKIKKAENQDYVYIHKGIAERVFNKTFLLGEYVEVSSASLLNGILLIELNIVVPDDKKPKEIPINLSKQLLNE